MCQKGGAVGSKIPAGECMSSCLFNSLHFISTIAQLFLARRHAHFGTSKVANYDSQLRNMHRDVATHQLSLLLLLRALNFKSTFLFSPVVINGAKSVIACFLCAFSGIFNLSSSPNLIDFIAGRNFSKFCFIRENTISVDFWILVVLLKLWKNSS